VIIFQGPIVYEMINPYPQFFSINTSSGNIMLVESLFNYLDLQYMVSTWSPLITDLTIQYNTIQIYLLPLVTFW